MRPEVAIRKIESFSKRFGPSRSHLYLAYHAAFPLALTPDLLYRIWANFQQDSYKKKLNIDWIAVADLLLSNLCDEVGHELYEMDIAVRNALLKRLKEDARFGEKRIKELSNFLLAYVRKDLHSSESDKRDFAESQQWTALAYKDPKQAAQKLAEAFKKAYNQDRAELVRLATLTEILAQPVEDFEKLLIYARAIGHFARKRLEDAKNEVSNLSSRKGNLVSISGVDLQIPSTLVPLRDIEYRLGGCLSQDDSSYIKRQADEHLYNALKAGELINIFAPIQMGKSSLLVQVMNRFKNEGFACAYIDLSTFGSGVDKNSFQNFCYSFIYTLVSEFALKSRFNLREWWERETKWLSTGMSFHNFIDNILKEEINQDIIIFIDEIDYLIDKDFTADVLSLLRSLYERKYFRQNNELKCNFVLSGRININSYRLFLHTSPFNIGVRIELKEFTYEEALPLAGGLAEKTDNPQQLLKYILEWTGGQPFLTQKLCSLVKKSKQSIPTGTEKDWLDNLVRTQIIENWKFQDHPVHLTSIEHRILDDQQPEVLSLYESILQGEGAFDKGAFDKRSNYEALQTLLSTGLVIRDDDKLKVANKIYAEVFNQEWIEINLSRLAIIESNKQVDYTQLGNLLAEGKWKEADEETARLMFKIADREKERWLRVEDIEQFPSRDLQTIDQLWVEYSNGRFGFSVQKQIYQSLGGTKEFNQKITESFWDKVGLIINNQPYWSQYDNLIFNLSAPIGHLPIRYDVETPEGVIGIVEGLLSRPDLVLPEVENKQSETLQTYQFETVTVNRKGEIIKTETKKAQYFTEYLGDGVTLDMVYIPGGTFLMGSPEGEGNDGEKPQHEVKLQSFFMGKYPVTQAQWRVVANLPKIHRNLEPYPSRFKGDNRPVEKVIWYDAIEFCNRLSKYTGRQYRLPSEAEWEYACRAGTTTPFHFGETITDKLVNYNASKTYADESKGEYRKETTSVGQFKPNAFGLYDMHGNVWEWCLDNWHDNYKNAPSDGTAWVDKGESDSCIIRGGSWNDRPGFCCSTYRDDHFRGRQYIYKELGFRVVSKFV